MTPLQSECNPTSGKPAICHWPALVVSDTINILSHIFLNTVPTTSPDNVTISVVNATAISLSWEGVITRVGVLRDYVIRVLEVDTRLVSEYRTSFTSITIPVHPDYVYNSSISAFTVATGPFSDVVTVKTPQAGKGVFLLVLQVYHNDYL